ncbi:MAG: DnaD domain protein [Anaerolineales bacterium]|nr:DnaD domain protein [Anaerolineales bacterium]MCB9127233.1 DnaD domain protein [Ardenticatenales bacterium]
MDSFLGFPGGPVQSTPLPNLFWVELLPQIDDLAELKLTLHCLWRLHRKEGKWRYLTLDELEADDLLLSGLREVSVPPRTTLHDAVARAVARGTLLRLDLQRDGFVETWLLANTERGRELVARAERGEPLPDNVRPAEALLLPQERPSIFRLYEQNVGLLQPIIAEELQQAARRYPEAWVEDAFRLAAERNIRNWRYIRSILERWAQEGREDGYAPTRSVDRRAASTRRRFRDRIE